MCSCHFGVWRYWGGFFCFLGEGERGPPRCAPFPGTPHSATRRGRRGYFARRADVWGLRVPGPDAMNCCQRFHVALWLGRRYGPGREPHQQSRPPPVHGCAETGRLEGDGFQSGTIALKFDVGGVVTAARTFPWALPKAFPWARRAGDVAPYQGVRVWMLCVAW